MGERSAVACTAPAAPSTSSDSSGGGVRGLPDFRSWQCVSHHRLFRATIRMHISCWMRLGSAWREANVEDTDLETVITYLLQGQFANPVRVIGFNAAEGWARDVSEDVARELRQRCADQDRDLPEFLQEFGERCMGRTEKSR